MRSSVSLGLLLWRGFAWKCSPPSQGCLCKTKKKDTHTHNLPSRSMSLALSIWIIRVMLGCKKILSNRTIPFNDETLGQNIKDASTITHHSPLQVPTHKHQSPRWVTSFPKGDYRYQRMLDSEATHTWEMQFHIHTQNTSIFSSMTLQIKQP